MTIKKKLTLEEAKNRSIELWTWLAETGAKHKSFWPGWKKYGECFLLCFLCEYTDQHSGSFLECRKYCPLAKGARWDYACERTKHPYLKWTSAGTPKTRKKYAALLLEKLQAINGS